jgi:hypothetical protein
MPERAFSDEEYKRGQADINRQLQQASNSNLPVLDEAMELFSDITVLWNEATADERKRLVSTLMEMAYVDLITKKVTAIKPTPAFKALFGVGIDASTESPIEPQSLNDKLGDNVGVGGDGGGSRFPCNRA